MTPSTPDGCLHAIVLDAGAADESIRRALGEATVHRESHPLRALAAACRLEIAAREGAAWGLPPRDRVAIVLPDAAVAADAEADGRVREFDRLQSAVRRHLPRIELWRIRGESLDRLEGSGDPAASAPPSTPARPHSPPPSVRDAPVRDRTVTPEEIRMLLDGGSDADPPPPWGRGS